MVLLFHISSWDYQVAKQTVNHIKSNLYPDNSKGHVSLSPPFKHFPFPNKYIITLNLDLSLSEEKKNFSKLKKYISSRAFTYTTKSLMMGLHNPTPSEKD